MIRINNDNDDRDLDLDNDDRINNFYSLDKQQSGQTAVCTK